MFQTGRIGMETARVYTPLSRMVPVRDGGGSGMVEGQELGHKEKFCPPRGLFASRPKSSACLDAVVERSISRRRRVVAARFRTDPQQRPCCRWPISDQGQRRRLPRRSRLSTPARGFDAVGNEFCLRRRHDDDVLCGWKQRGLKMLTPALASKHRSDGPADAADASPLYAGLGQLAADRRPSLQRCRAADGIAMRCKRRRQSGGE